MRQHLRDYPEFQPTDYANFVKGIDMVQQRKRNRAVAAEAKLVTFEGKRVRRSNNAEDLDDEDLADELLDLDYGQSVCKLI